MAACAVLFECQHAKLSPCGCLEEFRRSRVDVADVEVQVLNLLLLFACWASWSRLLSRFDFGEESVDVCFGEVFVALSIPWNGLLVEVFGEKVVRALSVAAGREAKPSEDGPDAFELGLRAVRHGSLADVLGRVVDEVAFGLVDGVGQVVCVGVAVDGFLHASAGVVVGGAASVFGDEFDAVAFEEESWVDPVADWVLGCDESLVQQLAQAALPRSFAHVDVGSFDAVAEPEEVDAVGIASVHGRALVEVQHDLEDALCGLGEVVAGGDAVSEDLDEFFVVFLFGEVDDGDVAGVSVGVDQVVASSAFDQAVPGLDLLWLDEWIDRRAHEFGFDGLE